MSSLAYLTTRDRNVNAAILSSDAIEGIKLVVKARNAALISAINNEDYEALVHDFLAPDFEGRFYDVDYGLNAHETCEWLRGRRQSSSQTRFAYIEVLQTWIDVSLDGKTASATLETEQVGPLTTRGLGLYKWKHMEGRWMCYHHVFMKNICDNSAVPLG